MLAVLHTYPAVSTPTGHLASPTPSYPTPAAAMFSLGLKCQRPLARPAPAQAQRSARRVTVCAQPGQSIDNCES